MMQVLYTVRRIVVPAVTLFVVLSAVDAMAQAASEAPVPAAVGFDDTGLARVQAGDDVVFAGAMPLVWLSGADEPVPLIPKAAPAKGKEHTGPLGTFEQTVVPLAGGEWRIDAYKDKPFVTAGVSFVNTGSEPVQVMALMPFAAGSALGGTCTLGAGTNRAPILDSGDLTNPMAALNGPDADAVESLWNAAVYNADTGRSIIAGFLTTERAHVQLRLERDEDRNAPSLAQFGAVSFYDPPVTVAPGERLGSEVVYLAVGESCPLDGLARFGASVGAYNALHPSRTPLPHGWDSWSTKFEKDINEERLLASLDFMDKSLKRYGWTHFSIDSGWERAEGDWEPLEERFPHGMKWLADRIHERGMTAGLWTDPFTVNLDTPLAKEHPEWLAKPNTMGRTMLGDNEAILDITHPGAREYVRQLYDKIRNEWGYDVLIEIDFIYHILVAESYAQPGRTRVEIMHDGLQAIREGFGNDGFIMGVSPYPITGMMADGMRIGFDCAPIWQKAPKQWPRGCVDTLTNAAKRFYFNPYVFAPDQDCAYFGHAGTRERWDVADSPPLTHEQSVAWLTGAALTGGVVKIGDCLADLTPEQVGVLRRILPVSDRPARPIDLFERPDPRVWVLPMDCPIGRWHIVGVFNWVAKKPAQIPLDFAAMGLDPATEYAVFDFWPGEFVGMAREGLNLDVPAGSVRLLSLRPNKGRPMFLGTDVHITQGATDFTKLVWDADQNTLEGAFDGIADTDYVLSVLVPKGWRFEVAEATAGKPRANQDSRLLTLGLHVGAPGPVHWNVRFSSARP